MYQMNLNLNIRGLPQSATLSINEKCDLLKKEGRKVYKLGLGQSPFPVARPVVDELKKNAFQKDYLPVKGLPELRETVAKYHSKKHGNLYSAEDVLIGPGSKELMFLLQYVFYGDLVIPTPSWVSYAPQAHIIGRHVRWIPTKKENNWMLTAEDLINKCKPDPLKPRIVILNYPSNPVGVSYTEKEIKAIAAAAKKYKVILLSDEIYGEIHHEGKHLSISRYYPEGTIISGGLSKWCGAGGWRLGTFVFPSSMKWLLDAMAVMASETFTSTSAPIQYAAVKAFSGSKEILDYLTNVRSILKMLGNNLHSRLINTGIEVPKPEGGFYLFADFSNYSEQLRNVQIYSSEQLCGRLLEETGVAILPGSSFGRPETEYTVRIAYVNFNGDKAIKNFNKKSFNGKNEKFLKESCPETLEAIDLICKWIKEL